MKPIRFLIHVLWFKCNGMRKYLSRSLQKITYLDLSLFDPKFWKYLGIFGISIFLLAQREELLNLGKYLLGFRWFNLVAWSFYAELSRLLLISLAQAFLLIFSIGAILSILRWLSGRRAGTLVFPFQNVTGDKQYDSPVVADALVAEIHRIRHIHRYLGKPDPRVQVIRDNIPAIMPNHENLEKSLNDIGTVGMGESHVAIGPLLLLLQRFWIFGYSGRLITGNIHRKGENALEIVARIEDHQVRAWEASKTVNTQKDWDELIREISLKLIIHLEPDLSAESWQAFGKFTDAISAFHRYQQQQDVEALREAYQLCEESLNFQSDYEKLANLFCRIGNAYYRDDRAGDEGIHYAEQSFKHALSLEPNNAYAHNGLGNIYYKNRNYYHAEIHYTIASKKEPKLPYPYNGLGNIKSAQYAELCDGFDFKREKDHQFYYDCQKNLEYARLAEKNYKEAILRDLRFTASYYNLGLLYYDNYRYFSKFTAAPYIKRVKKTFEAAPYIKRVKISIYIKKFKISIYIKWIKHSYRLIQFSNRNWLEQWLWHVRWPSRNWLKEFVRYHEYAKELAPVVKENADVYDALGWAYFILGKEGGEELHKSHRREHGGQSFYCSSIKEFEEATVIDTDFLPAHINMGITYLNVDEHECPQRLKLAHDAFSQAFNILSSLNENKVAEKQDIKSNPNVIRSFSNSERAIRKLELHLYQMVLFHLEMAMGKAKETEPYISEFKKYDISLLEQIDPKGYFPLSSILENINVIKDTDPIRKSDKTKGFDVYKQGKLADLERLSEAVSNRKYDLLKLRSQL